MGRKRKAEVLKKPEKDADPLPTTVHSDEMMPVAKKVSSDKRRTSHMIQTLYVTEIIVVSHRNTLTLCSFPISQLLVETVPPYQLAAIPRY